MTAESAEQLAQNLLLTAHLLGRAINEISEAERDGAASVMAEPDAAEQIQLAGPDLCRALRILAMRLDRAALVKSEEYIDAASLLGTAVDAWESQGSRIVEQEGQKFAAPWLSLEWMNRAAALSR